MQVIEQTIFIINIHNKTFRVVFGNANFNSQSDALNLSVTTIKL
jgi:hypothetical protein